MKKRLVVSTKYLVIDEAFRNKYEIIKLCLNFLKVAQYSGGDFREDENCVLVVDKMSRLFIRYGESIHTIHFPFTTIMCDDKAVFYLNEIEINSKTITILQDFFSRCDAISEMDDFYEIYLQITNEYELSQCEEKDTWEMIKTLVLFEPGYLRYDRDFSDSMNEYRHPPYHIDFYYSNTATFKIGLYKDITLEELELIIDKEQNCWFAENKE